MLDELNAYIDQFQPEFIKAEDLAFLSKDTYIPKLSDLFLPTVVVTLLSIVTRYFVDRLFVIPIGHYYGLKDKPKNIACEENPFLEKEYLKTKRPNKDQIYELSKKSGQSENDISIWFRKRQQQGRTSTLKKFQDASWHFVFYLIMSWYGIYILWDKPWFADAKNCWRKWPLQHVTDDIYWYYIIELGFYISGVYMLFTDHKRKDFTEFIVHHAATIFLITVSFMYNQLRIGSLIMCVHDQVDYILSGAKMFDYVKKSALSDALFVIFALVWILTRLGLYPFVILYSVFVELPSEAESVGATATSKWWADSSTPYTCCKIALSILQILHLIWTVLIIKSGAAKLTKGSVKDARSDNEDSEEEEEDIEPKTYDKLKRNGLPNSS